MTERFRRGEGLVSLNTSGMNDSISLNSDPANDRPKGEMGTIAHFGFRLADPDDLDQAIGEVIAASGTLVERGEQGAGRRYAYVADPDGHLIEP